MEWSNLKIVLAIGRGGSMTAAANLLQIDQTTIGRRLSALEHDLGCTLFVRSKAGFVATDQGEIVLEHARKCEFDLNEMQDQLQESAAGVSGIIRLVANPWMLQLLAAHPFLRLSKRHPLLELRMSGRLPPVPLHSESTVSLWFDAPALPTDIAIPICKIPFATYRAFGTAEEGANWVQFRDDAATGPTQPKFSIFDLRGLVR